MSLPDDFPKKLAENSDDGLYEMLRRAGDYEPEALSAAQEEIRRRGLPIEPASVPNASGVQKKSGKPQSRLSKKQRIVVAIAAAIAGIYALLVLARSLARMADMVEEGHLTSRDVLNLLAVMGSSFATPFLVVLTLSAVFFHLCREPKR